MAVNFCGNCGNRLEEGEQFCTKCGAKIEERPERPVFDPQPQPVQQYNNAYQQQYSSYSAPEQTQSPALAIVGFVLSFVVSPVGLILGIIGMTKYKTRFRGFCKAAIIISAISMFLYAILMAILVPSILGYINASRRSHANSTARTIQYTVDSFFESANNSGYGMKTGESQEFDIIVDNNVWTVSAANPANFRTTGSVRWGSEPKDRRSENSNGDTDGETMIADALKNKLPTIKAATIHVVLRNNNCTAAAFLNDSTRKLAEGGDYPPVKSNGCFADPNIWQRNNKTSVVGLAPLSSSSISYYQIA